MFIVRRCINIDVSLKFEHLNNFLVRSDDINMDMDMDICFRLNIVFGDSPPNVWVTFR